MAIWGRLSWLFDAIIWYSPRPMGRPGPMELLGSLGTPLGRLGPVSCFGKAAFIKPKAPPLDDTSAPMGASRQNGATHDHDDGDDDDGDDDQENDETGDGDGDRDGQNGDDDNNTDNQDTENNASQRHAKLVVATLFNARRSEWIFEHPCAESFYQKHSYLQKLAE